MTSNNSLDVSACASAAARNDLAMIRQRVQNHRASIQTDNQEEETEGDGAKVQERAPLRAKRGLKVMYIERPVPRR